MAARSKSFKPRVPAIQTENLEQRGRNRRKPGIPERGKAIRTQSLTEEKPPDPSTVQPPKQILSPRTFNKLNKKSLLLCAAPEDQLWMTDESIYEDTMLSPIKEETAEFTQDLENGVLSKIRKKDDPFAIHKRMALIHHNMWIECLKGWWEVLEPCMDDESSKDGYLLPSQYLDLNVRMQKSVVEDFVYENAYASAWEDWKIDTETLDARFEFPAAESGPNQSFNSSYESRPMSKGDVGTETRLTFEQFSEFIFEVAQPWCPTLYVENYLLIVNAIMINITSGIHLKTSKLQNLNDVEILIPEFFEILNDLNKVNERLDSIEFVDWYKNNFTELGQKRRNIIELLLGIFLGDARIMDIWSEHQPQDNSMILLESTRRLENRLRAVVTPSHLERLGEINCYVKKKKVTDRTEPHFISVSSTNISHDSGSVRLPPIAPSQPLRPNQPILHPGYIEYRRKVKMPIMGVTAKLNIKDDDNKVKKAASTFSEIEQIGKAQIASQAPSPDMDKVEVKVVVPKENIIKVATVDRISVDSQTDPSMLLDPRPGSAPDNVTIDETNSMRPSTTPNRDMQFKTKTLVSKQTAPYETYEDEPKNVDAGVQLGSRTSSEQVDTPENLNAVFPAPESEFSPDLRYTKEDIKFSRIDKEYRNNTFRAQAPSNLHDYGLVNKISPLDYETQKKESASETIKQKQIAAYMLQNRKTRSPAKMSPTDSDQKTFGSQFNQPPESIPLENMILLKTLTEDPGMGIEGRAISPSKDTEHQYASLSPFQTRTTHNCTINMPNAELTDLEAVEPKVNSQSQDYNFEAYSHLLLEHDLPEKLAYKDNIEYLYALTRLKYKYNKYHQSAFLKNYLTQTDHYTSRRDEIGGTITQHDWNAFAKRVNRLVRIHKRRRRRRLRRRKKRGKTKTLAKKLLWRQVFINQKRKKTKPTKKQLEAEARLQPKTADEVMTDTILEALMPTPPSDARSIATESSVSSASTARTLRWRA